MLLGQYLLNNVHPEDIHTESNSQRGPLITNTKTPTKRTRQNWTPEEYADAVEAH